MPAAAPSWGYAADIAVRLRAGEGPILEVGVGTGVVALVLVRRGRSVARGDTMAMPLAVADPVRVFSEVARVLQPRGRDADQIPDWASSAEFIGDVQHFDRVLHSTPAQEIDAVVRRAWPARRELDRARSKRSPGRRSRSCGRCPTPCGRAGSRWSW